MVDVNGSTGEALITAISALRSIAHRLTILDPAVEARLALERVGNQLKVEQIAAENVVSIERRS